MTKNFLRKLMQADATPETPVAETGERASCEEKLASCELHITHLQEQKELHARALKEMYQYLCKLDVSFRAENKRLQSQLEEERERSNQLIEITTDLWEIIEKLDGNGVSTADLFPLPQPKRAASDDHAEEESISFERVPELPELEELMAVEEPYTA
ncbi:MAG: hypothetical protein SH809_00480 [Rhodothermales bacterium]|nr:hypothetical protein [Rhodothermales bacterium]